MSNKPKIYGFCAAGCKWETIHREELEEAAAFILVEDNGTAGEYRELEKLKKYRIFQNTNKDDVYLLWDYKLSDGQDWTTYILPNTYEIDFGYLNYVDFILLDVSVASGGNSVTFTYQINGVQKTNTVDTSDNPVITATNNFEIDCAGKVYLYKDEAGMIVVNGSTSTEKIQKVIDGTTYIIEIDSLGNPVYRVGDTNKELVTKEYVDSLITSALGGDY